MAGRKSRNKGYRGELEVRKILNKFEIENIWQAEDPTKPDINVERKFELEVKNRKSVPKCVYQWLEEKQSNFLAMRRVEGTGRKIYPWLIVMNFEEFLTNFKSRGIKNE